MLTEWKHARGHGPCLVAERDASRTSVRITAWLSSPGSLSDTPASRTSVRLALWIPLGSQHRQAGCQISPPSHGMPLATDEPPALSTLQSQVAAATAAAGAVPIAESAKAEVPAEVTPCSVRTAPVASAKQPAKITKGFFDAPRPKVRSIYPARACACKRVQALAVDAQLCTVLLCFL